jgi:hypothetical protein
VQVHAQRTVAILKKGILLLLSNIGTDYTQPGWLLLCSATALAASPGRFTTCAGKSGRPVPKAHSTGAPASLRNCQPVQQELNSQPSALDHNLLDPWENVLAAQEGI